MTTGAMRPADGPTGLIAAVFIPHIQHQYDIDLASVPPSYGNAQWTLVERNGFFGIVSLYQVPPQLAITVSTANPGDTVYAYEWKSIPEQLWNANNVVGRLWNFAWSRDQGLALAVNVPLQKGQN